MVMLCLDKRVIVFHPPNTGGNILLQAFQHEQGFSHSTRPTPEQCAPFFNLPLEQLQQQFQYKNKRAVVAGHMPRCEFDKIFKADQSEFYIATLVRNPWCRYWSMYNTYLRMPELAVGHKLASEAGDFDNFIEQLLSNGADKKLGFSKLSEFIANQDGYFEYDQFLFFEKIENSINELVDSTQLVPGPYKKKHVPGRYVSHISEKSRDLIGKHCQVEIDAFGYKFSE